MPFRDLVGHRRLIDLLARAIRRDGLPPSLLFAGPESAPRETATAVAQALNCIQLTSDEAATTVDSCGRCSACTRIARGLHPDVVAVEPGDTGSIKVEQARGAIERSAYRPFEGRRRVVIVDEADAMEAAAQNVHLALSVR